MKKQEREKELARIEGWKQKRDALKPELSQLLSNYETARIEYERAHQELMSVKTKHDNLDRKIAMREKLVIVPANKSGIKRTPKEAEPVDAMAAFKSMTPEQKAEFIAILMK